MLGEQFFHFFYKNIKNNFTRGIDNLGQFKNILTSSQFIQQN